MIRCHRFYSEMNISVGSEMCLIRLTWSSFYVTEWKDATDSTWNLRLIWQFIDSSCLLKIAAATWPEQTQEESVLLCISEAARCSRGSMSQGLAKGSHGIRLLTPRQLYSQPGAQIESQWGCEQHCKHQREGYLRGHRWQWPILQAQFAQTVF